MARASEAVWPLAHHLYAYEPVGEERDRAYEGNETRQLVLDLGMIPVVPPKSSRLHPWDYDHALYKKRNEIERLFRSLKGFRRIFSRFEKLDVVFIAFISFGLIVEALRVANTPWLAVLASSVCSRVVVVIPSILNAKHLCSA